ncbi:Cell division protein kinase 7 [Aphelenchoides besseyi]|nr:Cell division protein kinase 7 [Aphelenchoides besseyi]
MSIRPTAVLEGKDRYETIKHLGEGQFANVFMAKDLMTGDVVAIKKIKLGSRSETADGINRTALREIKLLQEIQHDNVITLRDVFGRRTNIQLVFDFMDTDLENLIRDTNIILTASHIKNMCLQMLLGVEYLHLHWILHRDLKPNNLLMNGNGRMKIADFGLARFFGSPNRIYTHQVVTRWYRCPELLYGARAYGTGVDIWSVGCIIAELLLRVPFFAGESDLDQLCKIYSVLGIPTDEEWPERKELHDYVIINESGRIELSTIFTAASPALIQLMGHCLKVNPNHRCTCTVALQSDYFQEAPFACDDSELPVISGSEFGSKGKKKRRVDKTENANRRLDF